MMVENTQKDKLVDFDQFWDYNNPEETEDRFRLLVPQATGNLPYYVELLTQIARAQGLQSRFEAAHKTLNEAFLLLTEAMPRAHVRYLLERGRVFNSSKHPEQARPFFLEAWRLATDAGEDFYAIDAAHMMGIIEPPEQQLKWNLLALELAEKSCDPRARKWQGSLYNNIGWTYHDQGDYVTALDYFQRALKQRQEEQRDSEVRIAKWCVARALRSLNRVDQALAMQQELLIETEKSGESGGYVYEEIAECLLSLDQPGEAQPYFAAAYQELSKDPWFVENEAARLERIKEKGNA